MLQGSVEPVQSPKHQGAPLCNLQFLHAGVETGDHNNILNYFKHETTNAVSEGLNSKIQWIKSSAREFHSFE
ncbi:transposase [Prosthecochloris sp.]|uniref:transposase n=1 Tax=Prosthecochloris sp. TaxID=290513 RepID=UPI00257EA1F1|nr:transposase [Prosthecochloris sp.]